ncbi:MAG: acyl-CoA carboxylase subunit beta [Betaproteobacteria bacterium]|jgi:acetyl-CoA carboxylase carboxyltransferase component|nr:acyl-CoA carboxylase subunit beta [Betaproteobacteria bacterium]MBK7589999.1 acyl-CoA carboxylase subunit beta [Betaproteobacteria bacterium]MBK8687174.1 acyl-CoA carboxylase subunit beta [Betaproteobacteria bacterium]MBK9676666.1 acyl-CoA carboxylase subunit beta [Betaproteobacteria bacterium]MBL0290366.1 acyl-CoA carboxylase subunit beta [Betaproteobacteria bacterium]
MAEDGKHDHLAALREMRGRAVLGGGRKRIEQQHARGKLTARERLALLLDEGSFQEFGALATHNVTEFGLADQRYPGDGLVAGFGKVSGRRVAVFAQDFTVLGGSFSEVQANKICRIQDLALAAGIPLIGLNDSGGARIQEGVRSLAAYGEVFVRNVMASGVIPQISLILGPCAGGAVYSPALTDFVIMSEGSSMFLTGPDVIKAVTGEDVTAQSLGGAEVHMHRSGVAHLAAQSEAAALELVKRLLGYLPQNNNEDPPQVAPYDSPDREDEALNALIPDNENEPYDMRVAIAMIFDRDSFLEIHPDFAPNAVVGFARLDGYSIGIVANQPAYMSGALNIDASDKISRFIRTCDAYNVPVITFVDCPGFLPGTDQEFGGVIRHGAKIIYAYCESTVPKISIVTRKAMGGAYVAMSSKQMRTDLTFAWPTAQVAVMGAEAAVRVLYRDDVKNAPDSAAKERELIAYYREKFFNPYRAADVGQIDEVIEPRETRPRLIRALEVLRTKVQQNPPKKHGLVPS